MNDNETIVKNLNNYINHMLTYTVQLTLVNSNLGPRGVASGFIYECNKKYILISAGHCFREDGPWILETGITLGNRSLCFTVPQVQLLSQFCIEDLNKETFLDIAWVHLDFQKLIQQLKDDGFKKLDEIEIPRYRGPLTGKPQINEAYGFASYSQVEFDENLNLLHREAVNEVGMEFISENTDTSLYTFKLSREHQGHDYYYGSSGSPISSSEGQIVSIVAKGCESKNEIYGFPLYKIAPLLEI